MYYSQVPTMETVFCSTLAFITTAMLPIVTVANFMFELLLADLLDDRHRDSCSNFETTGLHVPLNMLNNCHSHRKHILAPCKGNFCSCGKCSPLAIFQHSCPLAYHPQSLNCISTVVSSTSELVSTDLQSDEDLGLTKEALLTSERQHLPMMLQVSPCDRQLCFLFARAQPSTSVEGDCGVEDSLHGKYNTAFPITVLCNKEKKVFKSWLVQKANHFKEQLHQPWQVIRRSSSRQHDHCNEIEAYRDVTDAVNLVMLLLLLSGDVELNPGPGLFIYELSVRVLNVDPTGPNDYACIEFESVVQI